MSGRCKSKIHLYLLRNLVISHTSLCVTVIKMIKGLHLDLDSLNTYRYYLKSFWPITKMANTEPGPSKYQTDWTSVVFDWKTNEDLKYRVHSKRKKMMATLWLWLLSPVFPNQWDANCSWCRHIWWQWWHWRNSEEILGTVSPKSSPYV